MMAGSMTHGSPTRLLISFSIPLLIGNIFQLFYNMADTIIVGRTIGVSALAAVGSTGSISFLVIGFVQGMTSGFAIVTAQRFGAKDEDGVRRSIATSIMLSAVVAVVVTLLSAFGARWLLSIMNTPADIIEQAWQYIVIIFWGIGASVFFNLFSCILRSLGDSKTPLIFLVVACIINIVLDFVLILYFKMGVSGAAVATVIAQLLSGFMCLIYSVKKFPLLHLRREDWRINADNIRQHLMLGMPMAFQFSITAIGTMIVQAALNSLGSASVAAFTTANKIETLFTQPLLSFGVAMATFSAQNYGAGKIHRIRVGVRRCSVISSALSILGCSIVFLFSRQLIELFIGKGEADVMAQAQQYLYILAACFIALGFLFIFRNTIQGVGNSTIPMLAGVCELVTRSVIAFTLTKPLGFLGVSLATPCAWVAAAVPLAIAYIFVMRRLEAQIPETVAQSEE